MIGKHVVIDTLDNFKTKLDLIPSSAIVLIKDVGQIYAHGTYFGAQKTYSLLTKTADGLAPKGGTSASSLIKDGESEWVLTVTNGENPTWRKLPANAFSSSSYTLPSATVSDLGGIKVGQVYTATFDDLVGLYYKVNIDKNGLAYVHVPWINNPYTASGSGITLKDNVFSLSLNSATKLDSAIGNKIYAVSLDKNGKLCVSVPWTDTNNIFVGATETKNGSSGMVPAPIANQHRYFLRGDGTWVKPNLSDLNDDVVNGKYLPLTGGTISGSLVIQASSPGVTFKKSNELNPFASLGIYSNKLSMYVNSENKYYDILHSGNYSSYALSLKGGTLDGVLTVNSDLGVGGLIVNRGHYLFARDNANADWIVTNKNWLDEYKLWHSGNDGSDSGLDADLLDGKHNGELTSINLVRCGSGVLDADTLVNSEYLFKYYAGIASSSSNIPTYTGYQNALLEIPLHSNGVTSQFYFSYGKNPYYRAGVDKSWNEIAYKTDNVASATKLQTARTIWGQSFDGTNNVTGNLKLGYNKIYIGDGSDNYYIGWGANNEYRYNNYYGHYFTSKSGEVMRINSSGNVGIGTASPTLKLDVRGNIYTSSNADDGAGLYINQEKTTKGFNAIRFATNNEAFAAIHGFDEGFGGYSWTYKNLNLDSDIITFGAWNNPTIHITKNTTTTNSDGNVGIGTNNPAYKLDVNGNIKVSGSLYINSLELAYSSSALAVYTPSGKSWFGMMNTSFCHIYTDAPAFYFNKPTMYANGNLIWHEGNDGSGSGLDADLLDGIDSTRFLRQVIVPNNTENDFNTFSNMTLTGRVDPTTGASLKNAPWSGSGPAGGYGTLTYLFNGSGYGTQMAWGYNSNKIYIRNRYWGGSGVGSIWSTTWDAIALTSDIPTVTNYYWANINVSASSNAYTTPQFGKVTIYDGTNAILSLKTTTAGGYAYLAAYNTGGLYGADIVLHSGSAMVLGSGESAASMYDNNVDSLRGSENLYLTADTLVKIFTNCDSIGNRKHAATFTTDGYSFFHSYINIGGHEKNASSPSYVWGSNSTDNYLRSYQTSSLSVSYATSAGNADTVDGQHFSYSNSSNSPTYLWASNSNGTNFLAARGSISVNYANYAGYLPTCYAGGQQTNPQTYFSNGVGVKVAMTGMSSKGTSYWSDTLWINGYSGGDVPYMCALHFNRDGSPRAFISTQSNQSSSYGTFYEFITGYNIGSQSVNYANSAGNADTVDGYHLSVTTSAGTNRSTIYFVT